MVHPLLAEDGVTTADPSGEVRLAGGTEPSHEVLERGPTVLVGSPGVWVDGLGATASASVHGDASEGVARSSGKASGSLRLGWRWGEDLSHDGLNGLALLDPGDDGRDL